jgi:7-carboxy-7-deazaguanine synthase
VIRLNDLYPTIQGEGAMTGVPMVLVRLQGCAVGCPWCDTKETWFAAAQDRVGTIAEALGTNPRWTAADPRTIAEAAHAAGPGLAWALVTGGEPAEQDLRPLVSMLRTHAFQVAVETSGTALGHIGAGFDWVCLSPKLGMPGGRPVLDEAFTAADEVKMVIASEPDLAKFETLLERVPLKPACQICLQPVSRQPKATEFCLKTCMERGWRLSIQTHKYLGLR